jgi:AcrR family transcriptional regulator
MSVTASPGPRVTARNAAARREILDAAWAIAREQGLAAITMRDLGARVGMRAQSLYAYYPSKNAIYDAMFADAQNILLERIESMPIDGAPDRDLRRINHLWLAFSTEEPVRSQLLYQRTLPGFEPSEESYRLATKNLEYARVRLRACGVTSPRAVDAWTAIFAGVVAQQTANEPGGKRWLRLADELTDMYLDHFRPKRGTAS